jgi:NYN domain
MRAIDLLLRLRSIHFKGLFDRCSFFAFAHIAVLNKPERTKVIMKKVSIYWDFQNVAQMEIAEGLLQYAKSLGTVGCVRVYDNWLNKAKQKQKLKSLGFQCIPVKQRFENAADFKLVIDCVKDKTDVVILISGDSYGKILHDELCQEGKKIVIVAREENISPSLKKLLADRFLPVSNFVSVDRKQSQKTSPVDTLWVSYEDAVIYFLEAVKASLAKGRRITLSLIDGLMRQLCPSYQGVACIRKSNGTKFSKFSQFVKTVAPEGKVRLQTNGTSLEVLLA